MTDIVERLWQHRSIFEEAADEIEQLHAALAMAEGCSTLAAVGVDAHGAVVQVSKETMGKLIAAEKEIERLRSALTEAADLLDGDGEYPATARRFRALLAGNEQLEAD